MFVKGLIAILENSKQIRIGINYTTEIDTDVDRLVFTANIIFPEFTDISRSYSTYIVRSIPIPEQLNGDISFKLLEAAFDSEYIKYVITPHVEEYYKSDIASWSDIKM